MSTGPPSANNPIQRHLPRILFAAVLLPVLFFLGWFVHWRWSNASAIRRLEAKARRNGEALSWQELAAIYPPIPDKQNGAVLLMDAWGKDDPLFWKLFREGDPPKGGYHTPSIDPILPYLGMKSKPVGRTNEIDAGGLQTADAYLRKEKDQLDQVRAGLRYSQFWFPIPFVDGRDMDLPHLERIKFEALSFSLEALVASERGNADSAITSIENTARMGDVLKYEPVMNSQFVRLACYHIALHDMERLLSRRSVSIAQLDRLVKLVDELRTPGGLRLSIISERAGDLDILAGAEQGPLVQTIKPMQSDRRVVLTVCEHLISLGDADKPEVLREYDSVYENYTNVFARTNAIIPDELSWDMSFGFVAAAHRFAEFETHRRAAVTALAMERFRVAHQGKLPQRLNEITPQYLKEIPADPYDGQPLRIKRLPTGFVVGSSGIDDGDYKRVFPYRTFMIER